MARTNSLFSSRVLRSRAKNVSQAAQTQVMSVLQGRSYNNILPYELWLAIFHHLTLSETLVIGQVCALHTLLSIIPITPNEKFSTSDSLTLSISCYGQTCR